MNVNVLFSNTVQGILRHKAPSSGIVRNMFLRLISLHSSIPLLSVCCHDDRWVVPLLHFFLALSHGRFGSTNDPEKMATP